MKRTIFEADHEAFRDTVRTFCEKEIAPHHEQWEKDSIVPRELWTKAGALGLLGFMMPEEYGGGGIDDFRFNAVLAEEIVAEAASASASRPTSSRDICRNTPPRSRRSGGIRSSARAR